MTLGERIQQNRKLSALSQEKLAEMMNISRQAVTKWESDLSVPSMEHLLKLSEIFIIPLDELANGSVSETKDVDINKRDNTILMVNLTILATIFIGGASHGLYQSLYYDNVTPVPVWICIGFVGGVLLMIRDRLYYKKYHRQLIGYDLLFILPVGFIPHLPIPYGIPLILMIVYMVTFMMIFVHKKIRPWKWRKRG